MKALILSDIHIDFQYEYAIFPVKDDYTDEECLQSFNRWWDMMQFPEADVLLSAGDFSNDYRTFQQFMKFISGKYKDVYIVLGNHDLVVKGATPSKSNQEFKTSEDKIAAMRAFLPMIRHRQTAVITDGLKPFTFEELTVEKCSNVRDDSHPLSDFHYSDYHISRTMVNKMRQEV